MNDRDVLRPLAARVRQIADLPEQTVSCGQPLEIILKDTHTVENQLARLTRWVQIAREEIERYS